MAKSVVTVMFLRIQHLDVGASDTFPFLMLKQNAIKMHGE
jgi:hypothetical protein